MELNLGLGHLHALPGGWFQATLLPETQLPRRHHLGSWHPPGRPSPSPDQGEIAAGTWEVNQQVENRAQHLPPPAQPAFSSKWKKKKRLLILSPI